MHQAYGTVEAWSAAPGANWGLSRFHPAASWYDVVLVPVPTWAMLAR
jgi:hypothetical protein